MDEQPKEKPRQTREGKVPKTIYPEIKKRREAGEKVKDIAKSYDVTPGAVSYILKRIRESDQKND